jgi:GntR family carbon starvation induced transcriptional regulator
VTNDDVPRTRVERTVNAIRADIVSGVLEPGTRLGVDRMRDRYGVGASTIREALSLLSADALVVVEGQRGFRVSDLSADDLRDLSNARLLLETHALRQSIELGDDDWEAEVVAAYHRLGRANQRVRDRVEGAFDEWESRNREFHEALVARCSSSWIRSMLETLNRHSERYRRVALATNSPRDVQSEHAALMDAALARDADRAAEVLAAHLAGTVTVIAEATHR